MPKLRPVRGSELIKILCNQFGFSKVRQKGSHVTLCRGRTYITVPVKEIHTGLLSRILKDCGVSKEEFLEKL